MGVNVEFYTRKIVHSGHGNHQVNSGGEEGKVLEGGGGRTVVRAKTSCDVCRDFSIGRDTTSAPQSPATSSGLDRRGEGGRHHDRDPNVEGRNGYLSLRSHQLRGLDLPRKRACFTAIHNFLLTRPDGTTAAERFFGQKPRSMFVAILDSVELAPAPLSPPRKA